MALFISSFLLTALNDFVMAAPGVVPPGAAITRAESAFAYRLVLLGVRVSYHLVLGATVFKKTGKTARAVNSCC